MHQAAASPETKCSRSLAKGVLRIRTARGLICTYNLYYSHTCPQNHVKSQIKQGAQ